MTGVWTYLRSDLRRRPMTWIALALIFGIGAGGSLAAMAGARRSATAYPRFLAAHNASDISTGGIGGDVDVPKMLDTVAHLPPVAESERLRIVAGKALIHGSFFSIPDFFAFAAVDPFPLRVDTPKVLRGRMPRQDSADEGVLPFPTADKFNLHVGDQISVLLGDPFSEGGNPVPVRIVGIIAAPGLFQGVSGSAPGGVLVPNAFIERYRNDVLPESVPDFNFLNLRLKHGSADVGAFQAALSTTPYARLDFQVLLAQEHDVEKAMHPYEVALWLLGIVGAFIVVVIAGQLLARQIVLGSGDYPVLRALGMGKQALTSVGVARGVVVGLAAIPIAIATAVLLSPLSPIGTARIAEPSPGFAFDAVVLGIGVAALLAVVSILSVVPAWLAARASGAWPATAGRRKPSTIASAAAGVSASAPAVTGLRMALEPGHGRASVPVRATILSVALALAALCATTVFAASMYHLINSPSLSGFTYDALIVSRADSEVVGRVQTTKVVSGSDLIAAYTNANVGNVTVGGRGLFVLAIAPAHGIGFAPIAGRAPGDELHGGVPEIAVGPAVFRRQHWRLGQTVSLDLQLDQPTPVPVRGVVVGTAAMPSLPFAQAEPGDGIMMTLKSYEVWAPDPVKTPPCCVVRFKKGVDFDTARDAFQAQGMYAYPRARRADLLALANVARLPVTLAFIIGAGACLVLVYALLTAISRRRRDLAVLKVFGFVNGQLRRTVAWEASALAFVAAAIALPAGVAVGRFGWRLFADQYGVVPAPQVPVVFLALLIPAAIGLANVVAVLPARAAARTKPALVLRAE